MRATVLWLAFTACSKTAAPEPSDPSQFLRATPIIEHGPPVVPQAVGEEMSAEEVDSASAPSSTEPSSDRLPRKEERARDPGASPRASARSPRSVIAEANAQAFQAPDPAGFNNAVMTYTFLPGGIYQVYTAPENVTDIMLEPGEELMGDPAAGDTLRWRLGVGASARNGVPQKHVFIKPTRPGLATNLTLNTNRRTYFLRLESVEQEPMMAVQWHYPEQEVRGVSVSAAKGQARASTPGASKDVASLHWGYAIEVVEGKPPWKPRIVFDDGSKTYIRFDRSLLHGEAPALFVIQHDEAQLVNYRVKDELYIVDRLFQVAELRLGQDDPDIVRITRKTKK